MRYRDPVTDDYLHRIGKLIRDARKHRGYTQTQLAEVLGTSQSAINRIESGQQNLSLEMLARIGEALDSEIVSLGVPGPMHLRVVGGTVLSGSIEVKSSKNAGVALLCAALLNKGRTTLAQGRPDRGGQPHPRGARQHRRALPLAQRGQRPRARRARAPRPQRHRRGSRASHPQHHHVPRSAAARPRRVRAPLCRRMRPRVTHGRAAHGRPAPVRTRGQGDRGQLPRPRRHLGRADAPDRADRARRHRHRERPAGRRPPPRRDRDPQRQPQLHGSGPLLLPDQARRADRRHRHDDT